MLHKVTKVIGFHLEGTDGEVGHIDDLLINADFTVRSVVVDTSNFIGGKSVLLSPTDVVGIDSPNKVVRVKLSRDQIRHSPPLDSADIETIETLPPAII